jgi:hypothetical protein
MDDTLSPQAREGIEAVERERQKAIAAPAPVFVATYEGRDLGAHRRCVYALIDPRTPDVVAYVGMTTEHPLVRLEGHLREARSIGRPALPRRTVWLRELVAAGVFPTLAVLEVVPEDERLDDAEQEWIRFYVLRGEAAQNGQMRFATAYGMRR